MQLPGDIAQNAGNYSSYIEAIRDDAWGFAPTNFASAAIWVMMAAIGLAFLIMYLKRLIVTAFLIMISPLITITYAIDKVTDNKSQALNTWSKEFFWTILIQPFHCLIYIVFVSTTLAQLNAKSFASAIVAIMCMLFIFKAEGIIKKIFGIEANNIGGVGAGAAFAVGALMGSARRAKEAGGALANKLGSGNGKNGNQGNISTKPTPADSVGSGSAPTGGGSSSTRGLNSGGSGAGGAGSGNDAGANNNSNNNAGNNGNDASEEASRVSKGMEALKTVVGGLWTVGSMGVGGLLGAMKEDANFDSVAGGAAGGAMIGSMMKNATIGAGKYVLNSAIGAGKRPIEMARRRNYTNSLNDSYNNFKQYSGLDDNGMKEKAKELFEIDLKSPEANTLSEFERSFASEIQRMSEFNKKTLNDGSIERVLEQIHIVDNNTGENNNTGGNT